MKTLLTRSPEEAAGFIRAAGVVAFPTETVYGLGADAFDADAIKKIFEAKQRPADNPLIAHVGAKEQIASLAAEVPVNAAKLIEAFFPGPLTIVLPKAHDVPSIATAGLSSIGVRMPREPIAREFLSYCNRPVVAPSANISGRPSPTTWQAVQEDLDGRIDCILQADETEIGLESTVVDCTVDVPTILRRGALSLERLRNVVPEMRGPDETSGETARSPGVKHKHYAPRARVIIVAAGKHPRGSENSAFIGLSDPDRKFRLTLVCRTVEEYARSVFEFFRQCDRLGIDAILCESVPDDGIGAALMDRLQRAAKR